MEYSTLWIMFEASKKQSWLPLCMLNSEVWYGNAFSKWRNVLIFINKRKRNYVYATPTKLLDSELKLYLKATWRNQYFQFLATENLLNMLIWATEEFQLTKEKTKNYNSLAFTWAAMYGNLKVLKWLTESYGLNRSNINIYNAFRHASTVGHLDTSKWIKQEFNISKEEVMSNKLIIYDVASKGSIGAFKWIVSEFNITKQDLIGDFNEIMKIALNNYRRDIILWICDYFHLNPGDAEIDNQYLKIAAYKRMERIFDEMY